MNVVQEIHRINAAELASGSSASWHDQYKDSAYVYVGGLAPQLTEGDVITIFSQYGEVVDISLPRDSATQKPKGFAFLMYADQRSTVLAVDNLGGAKVLERTLKVDHVLNYKQLERDEETGKMVERDVESLAAHPDKFKSMNPTPADDASSESEDNYSDIDIDDPMRDYLIIQRKVAAAAGGGKKGKGKKRVRDGEGESTKEERKAERERKRRAKEEKAKSKERKAIEGSSGKGREKERSGRREDERRDDGKRDESKRDDSRRVEGSRSRDDSSRRRDGDGDRRRDDRDDRDSKRSDRGPERRRDDDDDRRRDDRRDDRREDRGGGSAFADLEKWAKG